VANYLISGATGFVGSVLTRSLEADGHRVHRLTRRRNGRPGDIHWDPESGRIDAPGALAATKPDVVINLAGEPIAQRWTKDRMRRIRDSRVNGTSALARAIAALPEKPRAFVSGSAIGYYGAQRGDEILDESSAGGKDWLADVAGEWERSAAPAADAGIRTVLSRTGIVLGRDGGALQRMLPPFQLGAGGRIGSGRQWMSWISLEDVVRGIRFLAESAAMSGPVNLVAPEPVQNSEFADTLGAVLHRPAVVPVPALALRLAFGRMADDTILASQRVLPKKLAGAGFEFRHPRLDEALRFELRR
jgi:uncharacterized protein (TIGR01777 family)